MKKEVEEWRKVILLGTADSGKSTILRQLVLINGSGFSAAEKDDYRRAIWRLIRDNLQRLYKAIEASDFAEDIDISSLVF
jgi:adenylate kinase family enzyme